MKKSGTQTVQNSGPFRRTFGVGIRAANALPMSILTLAALLLALTLLSAGAPPASAQVDTAATEVEVFENWSLKPPGVVGVGGKFRLLIVTSTALNASTTVMDSYNGIIRDSVAAGHTDIRPYSHLFNALGSTAADDAIVNTKTTHTTTDMGVPIYYLNGAKVADNYSDFYDGTWDSHDPTNELGTSSSAMAVWTGSQSNGMKHANPLGNRTSKTVRMGNPTSSVSGDVLSATLIRNHTFKDRGYPLPFYGLSPVFVVRALSAPDMPQDLTATQGVASVRLAWAAPKSDGGSPIIRYEYRHEAGTSVPSSTNWTPAGTAQSVTVTGLMGGTEYTFEVRAVNSIGNGQPATASARTVVVTENTLVSNLAQPDSGSFVKIRHRPDTLPDGYITGPKRLAQNFTTGANTSGYTLDGIDIRAAVRTLAHHSQDLDFDVSLCPVKDQNQSPGAGCSELTRPETFDARSRLNFQAPADLTLAANTTYAVVLSGYGDIATTASDAEDTPATPGWSIGNSYHTFIIWSTDEPNNGYWHSNRYSLAIPFAIRAVAMSGQQAADPPTITAPPSVSESGADGQWTPGQTVQATVTFSEAVAVDTSGGTPTITLTPGATGQKSASYTSGGGTEALVFAYTLSEDDGTHTSMGVAPDSLALNGGSITSEATGVNADLSHNGTLIMGTTEDTSTSDDGSAAKEDTEENEPAPNHPATGSPIIAGTVQVGETLSVDTSGISDADGIANSTPTYQWIANDGTDDTDIQDATGSTYILSAADEGKTVKVRVSFTDDEGNQETRTSAPTAAVAATVPGAPGSLSVSVNDTGKLDVSWGAPESNGGSSVTGYKVQWRETPDSWDTPADVSETTVTGTSHTVTGLTDGVEYTFRVFAVNTVGDSSATDDESGTPRETTAPTLSSATVDGATLTLTFSEGLTETLLPAVATFTVNVEGNQRGVNTVVISGSTVTLTLASAVTSTDDVSVGYTVPSDAAAARLKDLSDNPAESFTGQAVTNSTAAAPPPLTASIHDEPSSHDGQKEFTFELRFSENPEGFSYKTLRDNAFTVTGGNVEGARRLDPPSNTKWQIKIRPTSNGDVTIVLPITEDCTADGAVCTGDRKLSNRLEIIVSGPTSQQTSQQRQESTAATGSPTISGTVQVGQTLAASTTGIADTDGLTNAAYSYQWIANDGSSDSDIADATASAYILVARDAGKTIKVKVSFTDDGGNEETLTSAVTAAVAATVPDAPGSLSVSVNDTGRLDVSWSVPYSNGGSAVTGYRVQWRETPDSWDTPADVSETTVTGTNHTVAGLTDGVEYTFRVFAVNTAGDSSASDDASGTPRETTAPTVSSATVDGATLTVTFSEGLTETPLPAVTTFTVNVGDNRRGVNSVAISGSTVTLTLASAATSTDAVSVGYTVPSDAAAARLKDLSDNPAESFTGQAVTNSTAAAPPPLTASIHDEPSSHDGQKEFTFELRFSENLEGFSYKTLRDNAFTVTGGNVEGARRLDPPSNTKWQIKIRPTSNGDVTITLPATTDCNAQGAICTGDGRPLSNRLEITVSGPGG